MTTPPRCPYCGTPDTLSAVWDEIVAVNREAFRARHLARLAAEIDAAFLVFPWPLRLLARLFIR